GGTGKTFTYNCLTKILKLINQKFISVAWTGIASLLLCDGRTVYSKFKLPLSLNETSVSGIKINSRNAEDIKNASIIIWDEISMSSLYALETINRLLKDVMNSNKQFGDK